MPRQRGACSKVMSTVGTTILEAFQGLVFQTCTVQEGGRTSSINRLFSRLNGLMSLTPCNAQTILQIFGKHVPHARSLCRSPSLNANRCAIIASSAAERSLTSAACTGITARQESMFLLMPLTGVLAFRIATLLNSERVCSNRTLDGARIARAMRLCAHITFTSHVEAVA
jgi:hypothetical protein